MKDCNITIKANATIKVEKNADITVTENCTLKAKNLTATIEKNAKIECKELEAKASGNAKVEAAGDVKVKGAKIFLNEGGTGITTMQSHQGVIDLITNSPIIPSKTIFGDV